MAFQLAIALYQITVKDEIHKKLLLMFKTEQEIKKIDEKYPKPKEGLINPNNSPNQLKGQGRKNTFKL